MTNMSLTTEELENMFREYTQRKDKILQEEEKKGVRNVAARRRLNAYLTYAHELSALMAGHELASQTSEPVPRVC